MQDKNDNSSPVSFQIEDGPAATAVIINIEINQRSSGANTLEQRVSRSTDATMAEAVGLALAIDLEIVDTFQLTLNKVVPATLLGSGKVEELAGMIAASDAELAIVNTQLTPAQQRNLERAWKVKVLDRTGLILEIFGRRARTREGRLQVELAHLTFQKSRLVRSWTHLERQRGGAGFLGGPGETQIEADRRVIQDRISRLQKQLADVTRTRALHRKARTKVPYPIVALVGYTNAGKSTLFNALTEANVKAKDQLFATLDPTMRQIELPHGRRVILSDTVGFIADLPTSLVAAFRATLEEVLEADVILHVRDISHDDTVAQAADVELVLDELGVDHDRRAAMLQVWNKADLLDEERRLAAAARADEDSNVCLVSAQTQEGLPALLSAIEARLARNDAIGIIKLNAEEGADLAWYYRNSEVLDRQERAQDGSVQLTVRMDTAAAAQAKQRHGNRLHLKTSIDAVPAETMSATNQN